MQEAMITFNPATFQKKFSKKLGKKKKIKSIDRSNEKSRSTQPDTPDNNIISQKKMFKIHFFKQKRPHIFKSKKM